MVRISSPFGWRTHPISGERKFHNGVDFALPMGSPLRAAAAGTVLRTYLNHPTNGSGVVVRHGGGWESTYLHLSRVDVVPGQQLAAGQQLGLSGGAPGTWGAGTSTGPHLHFILRRDGEPVDPVPLLTNLAAVAAFGGTCL